MFGFFPFSSNKLTKSRPGRTVQASGLNQIIIFSLSLFVMSSCQSVNARDSSSRNFDRGVMAGSNELPQTESQNLTAPAASGAVNHDGEVVALCTVRETEGGVVHRLEFLFNGDLGLYEVDHVSIDSELQESFRSYFARGNLQRDRIALDLQENINGNKFAELKAEPRGQQGLLLGTIVFTQLSSREQDNAECSVNF